jgi:hypothetical protein
MTFPVRRPRLALDPLGPRDLPSSGPVFVTFEEFQPGVYDSLTADAGHVRLSINRTDGVEIRDNTDPHQEKPAAYGLRTLSSFNAQTSDTPFVIDFSAPVSAFAARVGDYGEDADDLRLEAFSGPGATGARLAVDTGFLAAGGHDFSDVDLSVGAAGIRSVRLIGGSPDFPHSVYVDHIRVTAAPGRADLAAHTLAWDPARGGLKLKYRIAGEKLPAGQTAAVQLSWATGPSAADRVGDPIPVTFTPRSRVGTYTVRVPGSALADAPPGATHLVAVLDPDGAVAETREDNNVAVVADVAVTLQADVRGTLSAYSETVLKELLRVAGSPTARVSDLLRTPREQAEEMFAYCLNQGVGAALNLYGPVGDQIVQVYQTQAAGKTHAQIVAAREEILDAMEARIVEIGPANVSHHMADPAVLQAIDVAPSSLPAAARSRFFRAAVADPRVTDEVGPPKDKAYHLEIPQG